eukprot:CAMPEP_0185842490 /NCGR_PEP_ID=MMETSP1353-20130828/18433_1 /TAXON_ID=1077150 /ORGANISM="Erythrolobus australicus, Strain CCMP3124" /LENGTH=259 /DNA_ID=CAMNT_0028541993 /DNA_START=430 /DNA_END=1206 /DNA_ORIENTATION=+
MKVVRCTLLWRKVHHTTPLHITLALQRVASCSAKRLGAIQGSTAQCASRAPVSSHVAQCTAGQGTAPARHGTARHGTARHGTARHGTARHGTARHGTARHGRAQHLHGTAQHLHGTAGQGTAPARHLHGTHARSVTFTQARSVTFTHARTLARSFALNAVRSSLLDGRSRRPTLDAVRRGAPRAHLGVHGPPRRARPASACTARSVSQRQGTRSFSEVSRLLAFSPSRPLALSPSRPLAFSPSRLLAISTQFDPPHTHT